MDTIMIRWMQDAPSIVLLCLLSSINFKPFSSKSSTSEDDVGKVENQVLFLGNPKKVPSLAKNCWLKRKTERRYYQKDSSCKHPLQPVLKKWSTYCLSSAPQNSSTVWRRIRKKLRSRCSKSEERPHQEENSMSQPGTSASGLNPQESEVAKQKLSNTYSLQTISKKLTD